MIQHQDPAPIAPTLPRIAYTPAELEQMLPISLKSIYEALNSGRLKGIRITARRWIISQANLDAFLNGDERD